MNAHQGLTSQVILPNTYYRAVTSQHVCGLAVQSFVTDNAHHIRCQGSRLPDTSRFVIPYDVAPWSNPIGVRVPEGAQMHCIVTRTYGGCDHSFLQEHINDTVFFSHCPDWWPYIKFFGTRPYTKSWCQITNGNKAMSDWEREEQQGELISESDGVITAERVKHLTEYMACIDLRGDS